jgi:hypothetical protein
VRVRSRQELCREVSLDSTCPNSLIYCANKSLREEKGEGGRGREEGRRGERERGREEGREGERERGREEGRGREGEEGGRGRREREGENSFIPNETNVRSKAPVITSTI